MERIKTQVLLLHTQTSAHDRFSASLGDDYSVHVATSGSEALSYLGDTPIHVMVSAQDLPGMSGIEALREAYRRSPDMLGILIAPDSMPNEELEALASEEQVFQIVKGSASPDELREVVQAAAKKLRMIELQDSANDQVASPRPGAEPRDPANPPGPEARETGPRSAATPPGAAGRSPDAVSPPRAAPPAAGSAPASASAATSRSAEASPGAPSAAARPDPAAASASRDAPSSPATAVPPRPPGGSAQAAALAPAPPPAGELPPMRQVEGAREVEVLVLTKDDDFLAAVMEAVGGAHEIHRAMNLKEAADILQLGRCGVLVTDAAIAAREVETITARLREQRPSLVTVVAGERTDSDALMGLIGSGVVHRFVLKPISAGRTRLAIEAAVRKHLEYQESPPPPPEIPVTHRATSALRAALDTDEKSRLPLYAGGGVLVLALVGVGVWLVAGDEEAPATATEMQTPAETVVDTGVETEQQPGPETGSVPVDEPAQAIEQAPAAGAIAELLASARAARADGRLIGPPGDNALELLGRAVGQAPGDPAVTAELGAAIDEALQQAELALLEERPGAANRYLEAVTQVAPAHPRLPFLTQQVRKEQRRLAVGAAREAVAAGDVDGALAILDDAAAVLTPNDSVLVAAREEILAARDTRERRELLQLASQRLLQGNLIEPENDSARFYYRAVLSQDPDNEAARQGMQFLTTRLVSNANEALAAGDPEQAADWLIKARASGAEGDDISRAEAALVALRERLAAERAAAEQAAAEAEAERLAAESAGAAGGEAAASDAAGFDGGPEGALPAMPSPVATRPAATGAGADTAATTGAAATAGTGAEAAAGAGAEAATGTGADTAAGAVADTDGSPAGAGAAAEPEGSGSALPAETGTEAADIGADELMRIKYVAPQYPRTALRRGIEGWVDVQFVVDAEGVPRELEVLAAEPGRIFNRSAIEALEQWRYAPSVVDGAPASQLARIRVEFNLEE